MYTEKYRPQFHFSPPVGWMNDPNGLIYYRGEYHLFYQHNPHSINWNSMHWGHAVSGDMVHWRNLPIAYEPETEIDDYFTGSSVIDRHNVTGFFGEGEEGMVNVLTHRDNGVQQQGLGYSMDGRSFFRYPECVLPNPGKEDFRDPHVFWWESKKRFFMTLAVFDHVEFYTSKDLKKWVPYGKFGQLAGSHQGVWECPNLVELPVRGTGEKRWLLFVGDQGASKTQYFIGHFEGKKFIEDDPGARLCIDGGVDNYAGQIFSNMPDERCVILSWMLAPNLMNATPTKPWRSAFTVPRELWLEQTGEGVRVFSRPAEELKALRRQAVAFEGQAVDSNLELVGHIEPQYDMEVVIDVNQSTAMQAGVKLLSGERQEVVVGYDLQNEILYVNRSLSGDMSYASRIPPYLEARAKPVNGKITLRVLVDQSTLEVFTGSGDAAITALVFPDARQGAIKLFARKGTGAFERAAIYPMASIWEGQAQAE